MVAGVREESRREEGGEARPAQYEPTARDGSDTHATRLLTSASDCHLLHLDQLGYRGSILEGISGLHSLRKLYLQDNELVGSMPDFSNLKQLVLLDLGDNKLTGSITASLGECRQLEQIWLGNNRFSGALPPSLGKCHKLERLSLGGNKLLCGNIPDSLAQCTALVDLYLHKNSFDGPVPTTFKALTNLENLRLGNNKLDTPEGAPLKDGKMEWKRDYDGIQAFLAAL
jgi:Leucine-rich repeat (LRR) protein